MASKTLPHTYLRNNKMNGLPAGAILLKTQQLWSRSTARCSLANKIERYPSHALPAQKCITINASCLAQRALPQLGRLWNCLVLSCWNTPLRGHHLHFVVHYDWPITVSSLDRRVAMKAEQGGNRPGSSAKACRHHKHPQSDAPFCCGHLGSLARHVDWSIPTTFVALFGCDTLQRQKLAQKCLMYWLTFANRPWEPSCFGAVLSYQVIQCWRGY